MKTGGNESEMIGNPADAAQSYRFITCVMTKSREPPSFGASRPSEPLLILPLPVIFITQKSLFQCYPIV